MVTRHRSVNFVGVALRKSSIGDWKVVEQDCRWPVEVLAPSDSLITLGKSPGTSCFASSICLHRDPKVGYVTLIGLSSTVPPPGD